MVTKHRKKIWEEKEKIREVAKQTVSDTASLTIEIKKIEEIYRSYI